MNPFERLIQELETSGTGKMKCFGNSMTPLIESGSLITFEKSDDYDVGDKVFCKVKGRYIACHLVTAKDGAGRYLISNNHGRDNGWTRQIYGKATEIIAP